MLREHPFVMVFLSAVILMSIAAAMYAAVRDPIHPSVVFPCVWSGVLLLIGLAQPLGYFSLGESALLLFFVGAAVFSVAALFGHQFADKTTKACRIRRAANIDYKTLTWLCLAVHLLMLPLWWQETKHIAGDSSNLLLFAFQLRVKSVTGEAVVGPLVGNYLVAGFVITPILAIGVLRDRLSASRAFLASAPWLATNLITNGRAALVQLFIVVAYLSILFGKRIRVAPTLFLVLLFMGVFGTGAVLVGKGDADTAATFQELTKSVANNLFDYLLQGPILFSQYFDNESIITPTWDALVFPCSLLQHLGACTVGELHQDFLDFGTGSQSTGNVYTVYLSIYPKYGILGVISFLAVYGTWTAFHHRAARRTGSPLHALLAGFLFSAVILSIFSDLFAPSLNFLIKAALLTTMIMILLRERPDVRSVRVLGAAP